MTFDRITSKPLLPRLSPQALELFLRGFHSPKPLFRVKTSRQQRSDEQTERGPELGAAVDELVQRGLMFDVAAMGRDGEAIVLTVRFFRLPDSCKSLPVLSGQPRIDSALSTFPPPFFIV